MLVEFPNKNNCLGNHEEFDKNLHANIQALSLLPPAEARHTIASRLHNLERLVQAPYRKIEVYTDPKLNTFCCARIPDQIVTKEGVIKDNPNPNYYTYLIGLPMNYVAGNAPLDFMAGEIQHEMGHALKTSWSNMKDYSKAAIKDGYDEQEILNLNNCLEDVRMERLVGGPLNPGIRKLLWVKNSSYIVPNIASGISKMSPTDQFKFLIKLDGLWNIYGNDRPDIDQPWNNSDLHPDVLAEYAKIKSILDTITGDKDRPALKSNPKVKELILEHIWPALKRLIDKYPADQKKEGEGEGEGEGESESESEGPGKPGKPKDDKKRGKPSPDDCPQPDQHFNPNNTDTWPQSLQPIIERIKQQHQQRLENEADQKKQEHAINQEREKNRQAIQHQIDQKHDAFETPEARQLYNDRKSTLNNEIGQISRLLDRFVPKFSTDEAQMRWGKKGNSFSVKQLVRKFQTGREKPLGKKIIPDYPALNLQLIIDVSGSMFSGKRIDNAVDATIAVCESCVDRNIAIEILATDSIATYQDSSGNWHYKDTYVVKAFNQTFNGVAKSKIMAMLGINGEGNRDGDGLRAALPRMLRQKNKMRATTERVGSLAIFITDSTTQDLDTKQAADDVRAQKIPLEGTAITPEDQIPAMVQYHFGADSVIPKSMDDFCGALSTIFQRNISHLKSNNDY